MRPYPRNPRKEHGPNRLFVNGFLILVGNVTLFPWQVVAIAWFYLIKTSPLRGGLYAYDIGLGKTVIALDLIQINLDKAQSDAVRFIGDVDNIIYKPTIVCFPASASGIWKEELNKLFPNLIVYYYFGSKRKAPVHERERTLPSGGPFLLLQHPLQVSL